MTWNGSIYPAAVAFTQLTVTNTDPNAVPSTIKGAAGQNANLTEWRNSANGLLAFIDANGGIGAFTGRFGGNTLRVDNRALGVVAIDDSAVTAVIKATAGQTQRLLELQDSSTAALAAVSSAGVVSSTGATAIAGAAGTVRELRFRTGAINSASNRWVIRENATAESGANAGSDFELERYDDSGASLGIVFSIARATGISTFVKNVYNTGGDFLRSGAAGSVRGYWIQTALSNRWAILANATAEGGADSGSDFEIHRYSDAGADLGIAFSITRSSGQISAGNLVLTQFLGFSDGANINLGTTTGTKLGTATNQKIGFYNKTPVVQAAAYTQTYATVSRTVPNLTSVAVATTAATNVTPYGYAQAQANAIPVAINALQVDVSAIAAVVNSLINDLGSTTGVGLHA